MKTNRILIGASLGLIVGSLVYMATHNRTRDLHAGIGGTWSADMRVEPIAFRSSESVLTLEELIKSGSLSFEQKRYLQAQYLSHLIIKN